jgi:hypothetical protein
LQPYIFVAAHAMLEIDSAINTVVLLSLDKHLSQTLPVSQSSVISWHIFVLFGTSLPGQVA